MGRSATGLSRKANKERKEKEKFFKVKRFRRQKLGQVKMKEHNKQQEVIGHNKAILKAKLDDLREQRRRAGTYKEPKLTTAGLEVEAEPEVEQEEGEKQELPAVRRFTGERWVVVSPGVVVREGEGLETKLVGRLDNATSLDLVQVNGRRGKIVAPLKGWVSVTAKDGASICQKDYGSDDGDYTDDGEDDEGEGKGEGEGDDSSASINSSDIEVEVHNNDEDAEMDGLEAASSVDSEDSKDVPTVVTGVKVKKIKTKAGEKTIVRDRAANKRRKKEERMSNKRRKR